MPSVQRLNLKLQNLSVNIPIDSAFLKISQNLLDIADKAIARNNLGVTPLLDLKASQALVNNLIVEVNLKANGNSTNTALSMLDAAIVLKANSTDLISALALKSNLSDIVRLDNSISSSNRAIDLKANSTDLISD